ncbi:UNVERIFIED_CONTAM: hypothetical protein GTU68_049000 [Idotea baltica]|nr:hypothetical protein [Idotea baltica]
MEHIVLDSVMTEYIMSVKRY